jgi:hypothetical protein
VLPLGSTAVHVIFVMPFENCAGSGGLLEKLSTPQLSLIDWGENLIGTVSVAQLGIVIFAFDGHTIVGGSTSLTTTVKLHVSLLPNESVTQYVIVVVPPSKRNVPKILFIPLIGEEAVVVPSFTIIQVSVVMLPDSVASRPPT